MRDTPTCPRIARKVQHTHAPTHRGARRAVPLVLAVAAGIPGALARAQTLDQHNSSGPLSGGTSVGVIGTLVSQSAAQTFTVGLTGTLTHVSMYFFAGEGVLSAPLTLDVTPVAAGIPDSATVLATQSITPPPTGLQWITFDLSGPGVPVTAGQHLALVVRSTQDWSVGGQYDAEGTGANAYAPGDSFYRSFAGPWIPIADYDLMFQTYVVAGTATGACCHASGLCTVTTSGACAGSGGTYRGDGSACAGANCPLCYANCDGSTVSPILNVLDFTCFLQRFASGNAYANCDGSTQAPTLNVLDFTCFLQKYAAGCS